MSLGIYIHIPFCIRKCAYCDFLSFHADEGVKKQYTDALVRQIKATGGKFSDTVDSVFIGGGTPSVLEAEDIYKITCAVRESFDVDGDCETTVEINPATVTEKKLEIYKKSGINRISMGVQSFCDEELKVLGRLHDKKQAIESFDMLRKVGFDNINLDLMFAIPKQTLSSFKKNLEVAVKLAPEHISAYSLIIEDGTPFSDMERRGEICEADENLYVQMFELAAEFLKKHGYGRYEISNFCKKGFESRHNLKYWSGENYLGFGLGAVGFYKDTRYENTDDMKEYIGGAEPTKTLLSYGELMSEYIITGLRKTEGIDTEKFKKKFGADFYKIYDVSKYISGGFMEMKNGRLAFTPSGMRVSNEILCRFV